MLVLKCLLGMACSTYSYVNTLLILGDKTNVTGDHVTRSNAKVNTLTRIIRVLIGEPRGVLSSENLSESFLDSRVLVKREQELH